MRKIEREPNGAGIFKPGQDLVVAGVDLPREKRVEIGLTYIYGIGRVSADRILEAANVDPSTRVRDLTDDEVKRISAVIDETMTVEGDLRREIALNIKRLQEIGCYRGIRHRKGQGSIGTQGCVSYMFDEKGQIIIDKEECDMDADDLMMQALDAGAEDFADEDDSYEITTAPADFDAVRAALEEAGITMASAEVTMIPQTYVTLTDEADITNIGRILDLLDDDDDVQEVYHNWEE